MTELHEESLTDEQFTGSKLRARSVQVLKESTIDDMGRKRIHYILMAPRPT
jgi:hypothetical protein